MTLNIKQGTRETNTLSKKGRYGVIQHRSNGKRTKALYEMRENIAIVAAVADMYASDGASKITSITIYEINAAGWPERMVKTFKRKWYM